jgi:hypothetical protein
MRVDNRRLATSAVANRRRPLSGRGRARKKVDETGPATPATCCATAMAGEGRETRLLRRDTGATRRLVRGRKAGLRCRDIGARNLRRGNLDFVHSIGGCFGFRLLHRVDRASSDFRSLSRCMRSMTGGRAHPISGNADCGAALPPPCLQLSASALAAGVSGDQVRPVKRVGDARRGAAHLDQRSRCYGRCKAA